MERPSSSSKPKKRQTRGRGGGDAREATRASCVCFESFQLKGTYCPRFRLMNAHLSPFISSNTTSPGPIVGTARGSGASGGGVVAFGMPSSDTSVMVIVPDYSALRWKAEETG
jgi:hypothetical protein